VLDDQVAQRPAVLLGHVHVAPASAVVLEESLDPGVEVVLDGAGLAGRPLGVTVGTAREAEDGKRDERYQAAADGDLRRIGLRMAEGSSPDGPPEGGHYGTTCDGPPEGGHYGTTCDGTTS